MEYIDGHLIKTETPPGFMSNNGLLATEKLSFEAAIEQKFNERHGRGSKQATIIYRKKQHTISCV